MSDFSELIHSPNRLRICAALDTARCLEFTVLEESLGLSTSVLSKQLKILTTAGYVELEKRPQSFGRPRTWASLTKQGRRAYHCHVAELKRIVGVED